MEGERDQDHKTTRERGTSFNNDEDPYGKLAPPSRWRRVPTSYTLTDLLTLSDSFQIGVCRPLPPPIHLCSLPSSLASSSFPFVVFEQSACFSHALPGTDDEISFQRNRVKCRLLPVTLPFSTVLTDAIFFPRGWKRDCLHYLQLVNCVNFRKIDLTFPFTLRFPIQYVSPL